jgi:hypothetical protein
MWADFLSHFSEICAQDIEQDAQEALNNPKPEAPQIPAEVPLTRDPQTIQTPMPTTTAK